MPGCLCMKQKHWSGWLNKSSIDIPKQSRQGTESFVHLADASRRAHL